MTLAIYGFGTEAVPACGDVYWGAESDHDAVECFVLLAIPVYPYRAIHVFDWHMYQYKQVPIQFNWGLFLRALFRRLSFLLYGGGLLLFMALLILLFGGPIDALGLAFAAVGGVLASVIGIVLLILWRTDQRRRNIRYVLGRHEAGSSDPATWTDELCKNVPPSRRMYKKKTYSEAVPGFLKARNFSQAMWAARYCVALEDKAEGEKWTDKILRNADVQEALTALKSEAGGRSFQLTPEVSVDLREMWEEFMTGKSHDDDDNEDDD